VNPDGALPDTLPVLAFQAVLLLARLGACGMVLPGLGEPDMPATVRLGLVLSLVVLLFPALGDALPPQPATIGATLVLVATEIGIGLWIGWLARLAMLALTIAGQAIGFLVGLASILTQDQNQGAGGTAMGRFLGLAGAALMLGTGLYAVPLQALADSYRLLPAGNPLPMGAAVDTVSAATAASFGLALRLASPFLLLSLVLQVASGLLSRAAPQAQVYVLTSPAQTLAGLALLATLLPVLLGHWLEAARDGFALLPGLG
jgi:flagellar biosynthetic protein FliR